MKKGEIISLEVERLVFQGKALARLSSGQVVFLEGALPGELVRAQIKRVKRDYLEAQLLEVLRVSPERVEPRCPHFGVCGGCSLQHASYDLQLRAKGEFIRESLEKIAGLSISPGQPLASPLIWGYRNKMEFTFAGEPAFLGLHRRGSWREVIPLKECYISSLPTESIFPPVLDWAKEERLNCWDDKSHSGILRQLVVRKSQTTGEVLFNIVVGEDLPPRAKISLKEIFSSSQLVLTINTSWGDSHHKDKEELLRGEGFIFEKLADLNFRISPSSFFQTNTLQALNLLSAVRDLALTTGAQKVLDLYSGTGAIALFLAPFFEEVKGIEKVKEAVEDARENAEINNLKNVSFLQLEVEEALPIMVDYPLVIVDPPRSGLHPKAIKALKEAKPDFLIYVSCNPSTLARDLFSFSEYKIDRLQAFDLFPHSFHVESLALLSRR